MIDLAKIADLSILIMDASIGFEMETFEFLSILKNHGMSSCMGVLTHLDYFKENKLLRQTKKQMTRRFQKDVYFGAKLYCISGLQHDKYARQEIHNLARFISIIKQREISWRANHAYVVADRFDVIHSNDDGNEEKDSSTVSFYGYVRGSFLEKNAKVHLMGIGDYYISHATRIQDPVPVDPKKPLGMNRKDYNEEMLKQKRRTLKDKEKIIYAPFSSLGALNFDKTSGYITIPDKHVVFTKIKNENDEVINEFENNEGQKMMQKLQEKRENQDEDMDDLELIEGVKYQNEPEDKPANKRRVVQE